MWEARVGGDWLHSDHVWELTPQHQRRLRRVSIMSPFFNIKRHCIEESIIIHSIISSLMLYILHISMYEIANDTIDLKCKHFLIWILAPSTLDMRSILYLLECPICLNYALPPVMQCSNGHVVCKKCHDKLENCHSCRTKLGTWLSFISFRGILIEENSCKDIVIVDICTEFHQFHYHCSI